MRWAIRDGERVLPTPGAHATCPLCEGNLTAKCGSIVTHHWAHHARPDCDPWWEPVTEWHRAWQDTVPDAAQEVRVGNHRADILTRSGWVVEVQHSSIGGQEIREREQHYGRRMVWLFDARDAYDTGRLDLRSRRKNGRSYTTFRWKHPRKSLTACERVAYLDLDGDQLLRLQAIHASEKCGGWGHVVTRGTFVNWMRAEVAS